MRKPTDLAGTFENFDLCMVLSFAAEYMLVAAQNLYSAVALKRQLHQSETETQG